MSLKMSNSMIDYSEDGCRNMLNYFRIVDFRKLFSYFGFPPRFKVGRKSELRDRAHELLMEYNVGFNQPAYRAKILDIYSTLTNITLKNAHNNRMTQKNNIQRQQIISNSIQDPSSSQYQQSPYYHHQSMHTSQARLFQVKFKKQRCISGNNNTQSSYQSAGPHSVVSNVSLKQQVNVIVTNHLTCGKNNANSFTSPTQFLDYYQLKMSPFYENTAEIFKLTTLVGKLKCSNQNMFQGLRGDTFSFTLSAENASYVSLHRDISYGKNEYIYQVHIRFCVFQPGSTEIKDYIPAGLSIRLNNRTCPIPLIGPNNREENESNRTGQPIDCTQFLKLNPYVTNTISVNWVPNGKTFVMGMYLVKHLTIEDLLQKLKDKEPKSSEDTKNFIIKKSTIVDPDLSTTSHNFSLVCPLGKMRMKVPARSINCKHLQCFDARIFILMNEKKPTWSCPTCGSSCLYDEIQIQSYFLEVVSSPNLPDDCIEIELLADGSWRACEKNKETVQTVAGFKEEPIICVNLDSDDENRMELKIDPYPGKSLNEIDLTTSDEENDENPPKKKNHLENEAQSNNNVLPINTVNYQLLAQVQPLQAVISSEHDVSINKIN